MPIYLSVPAIYSDSYVNSINDLNSLNCSTKIYEVYGILGEDIIGNLRTPYSLAIMAGAFNGMYFV